MPEGRPSSYDPAVLPKLQEMADAGATMAEMAENVGVSERTLYRWRHEHPIFRQTIKLGKDAADERVIESMYHRACGYTHEAVKIFVNKDGDVTQVPYIEHYPPDATSAIFWLKNRRSQEWRDRQEVEHSGSIKSILVPERIATERSAVDVKPEFE